MEMEWGGKWDADREGEDDWVVGKREGKENERG